jgi:hypothetical protein
MGANAGSAAARPATFYHSRGWRMIHARTEDDASHSKRHGTDWDTPDGGRDAWVYAAYSHLTGTVFTAETPDILLSSSNI